MVTLICHKDIEPSEELQLYYGPFLMNRTPKEITRKFNFEYKGNK